MTHHRRRLSALIDGELGDADRDQAHAHLVRCEACRAEAAALRTLKRRIRGLGEAPADGALTRRLIALEGLPATAATVAAGPSRGHARYVVAGAVALALGLGAASFAAGGAGQRAPTVTPEVDSYNVQHAATFGELPAFQAPDLVPARHAAESLRP